MGRRSAALAVFVLLLPASALADRHRAAFAASAVLADRSDLWGIGVAGDWALKEGARSSTGLGSWTLSAVGELSQAAGEHQGLTLAQFTALAGPRLAFNTPAHRRVQPFVQVLLGLAHQRVLTAASSFAYAIGAGVDVPIGTLARVEDHPVVALRAQYARHWVDDDSTDSYNQYSVGVAFRLNRHR